VPGEVTVTARSFGFESFTAAESEVIIVMAFGGHDPAAVPKGSPPATPVFMGFVRVKDKPTTFHLRITVLTAASAGHLALIKREVHMFGGIPVEIVYPQRTSAFRVGTDRERV
jgi:hypothetical protein